MVLIIGAGISGLSAANTLEKEFLVFEKEGHTGGLSTQYISGGHRFDFSGHYFHFKDKENIKKFVSRYAEFIQYDRNSKIHLFNKFIPFPVQLHLSYFPKKTGRKILQEIENRKITKPDNLEEFLLSQFGETLCNHFFFPFSSKYFKKELKEILPDMDKGSVPVPDLKSIKEGFRGKKFKREGYNPVFYYPENGLMKFVENFGSGVKKNIRLNEIVEKIDLKEKKVYTNNGSYKYNYLINTMPLKELIKKIEPAERYPGVAADLENISTAVINVILEKRHRKFHWVYLPDKKTPFFRAGYYPGYKIPTCYMERSLKEGEKADPDELKESAFRLLKELKMIRSREEVKHVDLKIIPVSYIIFNKKWKRTVPPLLKELENNNIYSIGRYGSWNYTSMSDDIRSAINISGLINNLE
ncbi:MAG: NAD(P)-binding protein [Acidobacteriota bacterium]